MTVKLVGYIITQYPYSIHRIANLGLDSTRRLILTMHVGDLLSIDGLGSLLEIVDIEVKKIDYKGGELRGLYIKTERRVSLIKV